MNFQRHWSMLGMVGCWRFASHLLELQCSWKSTSCNLSLGTICPVTLKLFKKILLFLFQDFGFMFKMYFFSLVSDIAKCGNSPVDTISWKRCFTGSRVLRSFLYTFIMCT